MKLSEMEKTKINSTEKDLRQSAAELKNMSQNELMQKLLKEVAEQKEKGAFDYDGLRNTIENIKMYLPEGLYNNLIDTLERIK